jgi:hypothetical protein
LCTGRGGRYQHEGCGGRDNDGGKDRGLVHDRS